MTKLITCLITFYLASQGIIPDANAVIRAKLGGTIKVYTKEGVEFDLPALKTDLNVDIQGELAGVTVVQTFINPTKEPLHATYLFPMNKDAAVHGMQMAIGDEIVEAKIKKIEKAKKIFKKAKKEGKTASLLTQNRPNMFTQEIANLIPGLPIKVTLKYAQTINKVDNEYQLVVPLVVGPRYQPLDSGKAPLVVDQNVTVGVKKVRSDSTYGQWEIESLPKYPSVFGSNAQFEVDRERVSVKVSVKAGIPITNVYSHTHELEISGTEKDKVATLSEGRTIDNRDFVLNYRLTGKSTQASMLTHQKEKDGYFSLLIEPPTVPQDQDITAREMIFVLDTSGSMSGDPMNASKVFMRHALKTLRPDDYFRIINFGDTSHELTNSPIRATKQNLYRGQKHIDSLNANGGTEIVPAIKHAFSSPLIGRTLRIVIFLTDGYVSNESEVMQLINEKIKDARIYAFGVGTSVNRYLLSEMGRIGHGFARYIDPTENSEEVAIKFARKLNSPLLTNISIDWNKLNVSEVTPEIIPDLFSGDSIRIQGKYEGAGLQTIRVLGKVQGREASLPLQFNLPQENFYDESTSAISLVWARSKISDYMRQLNTKSSGSNKKFSDDELKFKVTTLGLDHSLATKWTSFVAVSKRVVNPQPEMTPEVQVPLPMVKGVKTTAYPSSVSILGGRKVIKATNTPSILGNNMVANSIPEPETVAGLLILMVSGFAAMWLIRRRTGRANSSI